MTATIGYNVDSFGHNGMVPQILRKFGMDCYLFMRPNEQEKHMPNEAFRWVAPDGSEVLAYRMLHNYNDNFYAKALDTMLQEMDKLEGLCHKDNPELLYPYGVGNHAVEQTDPVVTDADGNPLCVLSLEDENGQQVPIQYLRPESSATMRRRDTLFVACVPAMGYATYFAKHTFGAEMENPLTVGEWFLENEHIRVGV